MFLKGIWILFTKEVKDAFSAPLIYIIAAIFNALIGWLFFNYVIAAQEPTNSTLTTSIIMPTFGVMNFLFLFIAPLLTMGQFAQEKKDYTLDLLILSDLSNVQILMAKLFSSLLMSLFMLSFTLAFPIILSFSGYNDWGVVLTSYVGLILAVTCTLSVGLFASSLTKNQMVAVFLSFTICLAIFLLAMTAGTTQNSIVAQILSYFSIAFHSSSFARGAMRSYSFIYFLSFIGFFNFLTIKSLESERW